MKLCAKPVLAEFIGSFALVFVMLSLHGGFARIMAGLNGFDKLLPSGSASFSSLSAS